VGKVLKGALVEVEFLDDFSIIIRCNNKEFKPFEDLLIAENNLMQENIRQAVLFAEYGIIYTMAIKQKNLYEREIGKLSAQLDDVIREQIKEKGEKPTETSVKRLLYSDEKFVELQKKLNDAEEIMTLLKQILEAFQHKKDCLLHFDVLERLMLKADVEEIKRESFENKEIPIKKW